MLHRISQWLYRIASGPVTAICLLAFLIFSAVQLTAQSAQAAVYSASAGTPDTSLFYTPADLYRMAESYGRAGRAAYIHARFTFDLAFPLIYGAFLASALSFLLGRSLDENHRWRWLNLIPLAAMLFDLLENICAARVMAVYPAPQPLAAALAAVFTPVKWLFVGGGFLLLLPAVILYFQKRRKSF